jgi:hypothetical protein
MDAAMRWEFVLALAAMLVVGTGALIAALMGSATLVTPGVVRVTYVGVIVLAAVACATLLVIEVGTEGVGPLAGSVSEADRDALHAASVGLAAVMLVVARTSLPAGGMVAAGAAGWLVGQVAYLSGARDLRLMANVAIGVVVLAYVGYVVTGTAAACLECTRGPWAMVSAGVGLVVGAAVGWASGRLVTRVEVRDAISAGAVLFVMASTYFLVRNPVRLTFTVLAIAGLSLASVVPVRILDRSRDLAVDGACLALAGLEMLVGPSGTVPVGVVVLLVRAATRVPSGWPRAAVALLVGTVGIALSVNVVPPWDEPHHAFFLFPMRDVAAGKSLLVDVNAQYGVGLIYVLVLLTGEVVETITPTGLSAWTNVANVALYVGLWGACAWLVRDWAVGSLWWLVVVVNRSVSIGFAEAYPSTGAWRFGLPWLLVADAVAMPGRMAPWRRLLRGAYWMVVSTWSLEVAIYSAVIFASDLVIDTARSWRDGDGIGGWRRVVGRLTEAVLGAATGVAVLFGVTRWRADQWPDTRHYFEYFGTYEAGLGFEQPVAASAWSPMLLGCAAVTIMLALRAVFAASLDGQMQRDKVVALVGAYGILQFTYYVFRPHSNNLLHVMFPPAILAVWLLTRTARWSVFSEATAGAGDVRVVVGATVVCGMALVGASGLTALVPRVSTTLFGQAVRLWGEGKVLTGPWFGSVPPERSDDRAALRELLARRYPVVSRVPMLLADDLWIHAVIGTPYVNAFPLSFAPQDALVPVATAMVAASVREMPYGTELVVEDESERLDGLRVAIAGMLCARGALVPVEVTRRVVVVTTMEGHGGGHDLCQRWGMVPTPQPARE